MERLLICKGKAGLGNRLLVALTAIVYAQLTKRRIIIDWSDGMYAENGENAFGLLFNCSDIESVATLPDTDSVYPPVWRGRLQDSVNKVLESHEALDVPRRFLSSELGKFEAVWSYSIDLARLDYPEDVLVMWGFLPQTGVIRRHLRRARSDWAGLSKGQLFRKLLTEKVTLQPLVRQRLDEFKAAMFANRVPTIGVHVRFTDNMRKKANTVLLGDYYRVIDALREKDPATRIFLATDSKYVLDSFEQRYGSVLTTPKEYPPEGMAMHFNAQCQDYLAAAVEALVDMHLLACCDYLVYPGSSTFSYISALLSGLPPDRVIDLQKYNVRLRGKQLFQWWQLSGRHLLHT